MPKPDPVLTARANVALMSRRDRGSPERLAEARRALTAAKLERHIREALAAKPKMTPEQRDKLALLLIRGGGAS